MHLFYAGEKLLCAPVPIGGWGEMRVYPSEGNMPRDILSDR